MRKNRLKEMVVKEPLWNRISMWFKTWKCQREGHVYPLQDKMTCKICPRCHLIVKTYLGVC